MISRRRREARSATVSSPRLCAIGRPPLNRRGRPASVSRTPASESCRAAAGGALRRAAAPVPARVGGRVGSGRQYVSWVAIDDVAAAIEFALSNDLLLVPVNVTAPEPVTNADYASTLGRVPGAPGLAAGARAGGAASAG